MNFAFSHSVWSTLARNESRLNEAFFVHAAHVFLIFGVNGDGGFCGFARMLQGIGEYSQALALGVDTNMWSRDSIEPQPVNMTMWDSPFRIEWVSNTFVPFKVFDHLRNPWNAGKPIRMSRDGTEVEPHVGLQLLQIISAHSGLNGFLDLCKYMPTAIVG
ncbi:3'-5' RNA helicase ythdc2 [Entophlyctis sp. JEL0112]|nr:3'-5' RNA helicase ythdc2 [Entophlyctis sp. JEL0112]